MNSTQPPRRCVKCGTFTHRYECERCDLPTLDARRNDGTGSHYPGLNPIEAKKQVAKDIKHTLLLIALVPVVIIGVTLYYIVFGY